MVTIGLNDTAKMRKRWEIRGVPVFLTGVTRQMVVPVTGIRRELVGGAWESRNKMCWG